MKEYGKTFTGITDAQGFVILDIPFTATVIGATSLSGRSPQNLVCNRQNMMMRVIDNTVYIDLYGLRIMLSDNTEVNLNTTAITQTIISPYKNELISAEMGYGVTSINFNAFSNCVNLTSVVIPNSVTSIGSRTFMNCYNLASVTIGNGVTSIGNEAFASCSSLTKVNIADIAAWCNITFSGSSSNPLYYAKHLYVDDVEVNKLVIPEGVTSIGKYAFYGCSGLNSVTISNNVTSIGYEAFRYCSGLTSVTIGNSVTSIGNHAFEDCSGLTSITFTGTSTQWRAITRGSNWHVNVLATTVYCEGDGVTVSLDAT